MLLLRCIYNLCSKGLLEDEDILTYKVTLSVT